MPLSAPAEALLGRFREAGVRPFEELGVLDSRLMVAASVSLQAEAGELAEVRELLVPGAAGMLPARLYVPSGRIDGPLVLYLHGGGWVTGDVLVADLPCRALALASGLPVASLDYRRSPETRYPGALEDVYAALAWFLAEAEALAGAESVVIAGDSAGGNLAAAVCLLAGERGGHLPVAQLLLYPMLVQPGRRSFPSQRENAVGRGLDYSDVEWFWRNYLPDEATGSEPTASPLLAEHLSGLPRACLVLAENDVLHDEGAAYGERLREAGVAVEVIECEGTIHGFLWMDRRLPEAAEVRGRIAAWLRAEAGA